MPEKKLTLVAVDDTTLEQTLSILQKLPKKSYSLREVIDYLNDELNQSLAKGYSYKELAKILTEQGIAIAEATLKQYTTEANKARKVKAALDDPNAQSPERKSKQAIVLPIETKEKLQALASVSDKKSSTSRESHKSAGKSAKAELEKLAESSRESKAEV